MRPVTCPKHEAAKADSANHNKDKVHSKSDTEGGRRPVIIHKHPTSMIVDPTIPSHKVLSFRAFLEETITETQFVLHLWCDSQ